MKYHRLYGHIGVRKLRLLNETLKLGLNPSHIKNTLSIKQICEVCMSNKSNIKKALKKVLKKL